jgi:hypothetical protein
VHASRALLEHLWRGVQSPTGEIGFFVELLEHCGLMCELERRRILCAGGEQGISDRQVKLDWISSGEQIAFVCDDGDGGAAVVVAAHCCEFVQERRDRQAEQQRIVTQSDVVLLLRATVVRCATHAAAAERQCVCDDAAARATTTARRVRGACARMWRCTARSRVCCDSCLAHGAREGAGGRRRRSARLE